MYASHHCLEAMKDLVRKWQRSVLPQVVRVDDSRQGQVVTTMRWCTAWCIYLCTPTALATLYVVQHSWMLRQPGSDTPLGWNVALPLAECVQCEYLHSTRVMRIGTAFMTTSR